PDELADDDPVHVGEVEIDHDEVEMTVATDQRERRLGGRGRQGPAAERLEENGRHHGPGAVAVDDRDPWRAAVRSPHTGGALSRHSRLAFRPKARNYPRPCLTSG